MDSGRRGTSEWIWNLYPRQKSGEQRLFENWNIDMREVTIFLVPVANA